VVGDESVRLRIDGDSGVFPVNESNQF
jgi:hypothetical protein